MSDDRLVDPEAVRAIEEARRARASSEAVLPVAEALRDKVRRALAENHFAALMRNALEEAARR